MAKRRIGEILQDFGLISKKDIARALRKQARTGKLLGEVLIDEKLVEARDLWQAWQVQVARWPEPIRDISIPRKLSELALGELASLYSVVPLHEGPDELTIVMMRPRDVKVIEDVRTFLNTEVTYVIAANSKVADAVRKHHPKTELRRCDWCDEVLASPDTVIFFNQRMRKLFILCKKCYPRQKGKAKEAKKAKKS